MKTVRAILIFAVCASEVLAVTSLFGQTKNIEREAFLARADSLLANGECMQAAWMYNTVLSIDTKCPQAFLGMGKALLMTGEYTTARDQFQKALDLSPSDIETHLQMALALRGIARAINDNYYWRLCDEQFNWVIQHDPNRQNVMAEYALSLFYQGRYEEAFTIAQRQTETIPNNLEDFRVQFRLFRILIADIPEAEQFLKSQSNDVARYALGEYWRRQKRTQEAEMLFHSMLDKRLNMSRLPLYLSLVRILYARDDSAAAEKMYWKALEEAASPVDFVFLFEDIKYILEPEELKTYTSLKMPEDYRLFLKGFWNRRKPVLSKTINPRLAEHYLRLPYAEQHFECFTFQMTSNSYDANYGGFVVGLLTGSHLPLGMNSQSTMRVWEESNKRESATQNDQEGGKPGGNRNAPPKKLASPEDLKKRLPQWGFAGNAMIVDNVLTYRSNEEFDDRGLIYIRHGKPDEIVRTLRDESSPNEAWCYRASGENPKLIFEFRRISAYNNEWRLGYPVMTQAVLEDRRRLDPLYSELIAGLSSKRQEMILGAMRALRESVSTGLVTERHSPTENIELLDIATSLTTFRAEERNSLVDIVYAVPIPQLSGNTDSTSHLAHLEVGLSILNRTGVTFLKRVDTVEVDLSQSLKGAYVNFYRQIVPADTYRVALQIQTLDSKSSGSWHTNIIVRDYSKPNLQMSDIQFLLPAQGRSTLEVEGIRVMPSPFNRFRSDQTLRTYMQIYNLSQNLLGKSRCSIEYEFKRINEGQNSIIENVGSLFTKKKTSFSVRLDKQDIETSVSQYMPFVMDQLVPGQYFLTVKVTDTKTYASAQRVRMIQIDEAAK